MLNAKNDLSKWIAEQKFSEDEKIGANILCASLEAPIKKILTNAGISADLIVSKLLAEGNVNRGYNVISRDYADMTEDGIIDPTDVVINEVQNAASVSGLLLTTEVLVVEEPADSKAAASSSCSTCGSHGMM